MNQLCKLLPWDSEFFGLNIACITNHTLTREEMTDVLSFCQYEKIDCLYFLADPQDEATRHIAEQNAFIKVDERTTFELDLTHHQDAFHHRGNADIRPAEQTDIKILEQIARTNHPDSRFFADKNFDQKKSAAMYALWIRKHIEGEAGAVFVPVCNKKPGGYISCLEKPAATSIYGEIGLIGVNPDCRGKGLGSALIDFALEWFFNEHIHTVRVATQGRNQKAIQLYQKFGFETQNIQHWYHKWFK